ncbi:MAG: hypothetical protein JKP98_18385 [Rhodobacteraceae bacterium]|nr:hypothetical protein [Paracoccaceae bacterium]
MRARPARPRRSRRDDAGRREDRGGGARGREAAGIAYDAAKRTARLSRAKAAHDDLLAAVHRAQADALEIEATAKRRLADEYDAAQARGEVASDGRPKTVGNDNGIPATSADLGLRRDQIHEARQIRDAEAADPGIVRRTLDERLDHGEEPTRAALRKMVVDAAMRGLRPQRSASRRNPLYVPPTPSRRRGGMSPARSAPSPNGPRTRT